MRSGGVGGGEDGEREAHPELPIVAVEEDVCLVVLCQ